MDQGDNHMRKPIIALTPDQVSQELPVFGTITESGTNHWSINWIQRNGAIPVIPAFLPEEDAEEFIQTVDGLFVTGGADIDPARYGEEVLPFCDAREPERDASDIALIKAALKYDKPIIMICRGCQMGNVFFGGTLYQDIEKQTGSAINHRDYPSFLGEGSHEMLIVPGTPLAEMMAGETSFGVSSMHHQGIKDLGDGVLPMGKAPDGLVESWYIDNGVNYVRAYQWHPEVQAPNRHEQAIINDFLKAVRARMK